MQPLELVEDRVVGEVATDVRDVRSQGVPVVADIDGKGGENETRLDVAAPGEVPERLEEHENGVVEVTRVGIGEQRPSEFGALAVHAR